MTKAVYNKEMPKPYISVVSVKPLPDYRLQVALSDGRRGIYDVSSFLDFGVFKQLKAPAYFALAKVFISGVGWPGGQDIGPFTITEGMRPLPRRKAAARRKPATRKAQAVVRRVA